MSFYPKILLEMGSTYPNLHLTADVFICEWFCFKAEGLFRITAENGQGERVRSQLNKGIVPQGIDVHCLAGLIKVST